MCQHGLRHDTVAGCCTPARGGETKMALTSKLPTNGTISSIMLTVASRLTLSTKSLTARHIGVMRWSFDNPLLSGRGVRFRVHGVGRDARRATFCHDGAAGGVTCCLWSRGRGAVTCCSFVEAIAANSADILATASRCR